MCSGGRIVNYLKAMLGDARHDVLFCGYQAAGTPGRAIQQYGPPARSGGWVDLDLLLAALSALVRCSTPGGHRGLTGENAETNVNIVTNQRVYSLLLVGSGAADVKAEQTLFAGGRGEIGDVEHRVAGADANPYLVLAVLLASAHHGITNKLDPGPAVVGDGYAAAAKENIRLPNNWFAAVDLFEQSKVLRDYLGDRFVDMFVSVKRTEQARFFEVVTELDFDWYLRNA